MSGARDLFDRIADRGVRMSGSAGALLVFVVGLVGWFATGPALGWSDQWHLLLNTPTTAITTGLVLLVQHSQTKDTDALHAKLDALLAASAASNALVGAERLTEDELEEARAATVAEVQDSVSRPL